MYDKDFKATDLTAMAVIDVMILFTTLEAPSIDEMHGEFDATLLRQPSILSTALGAAKVRNPLTPWRAKAFRPVDANSGRGYNVFHHRRSDRDIRRNPMITSMEPSRYDGRPVYQLDYRPFDSINGKVNMVDEIRRVRPGLYLGIGTWGFSDRQRRIPLPFMLIGPDRPYAGDLGGTPRRS